MYQFRKFDCSDRRIDRPRSCSISFEDRHKIVRRWYSKVSSKIVLKILPKITHNFWLKIMPTIVLTVLLTIVLKIVIETVESCLEPSEDRFTISSGS